MMKVNFLFEMKRNLVLLGLLFLAALTSCSIHEELQLPEASLRFRAMMEPVSDASTRVYVDDTYNLFWNKSDLVTIFYDKTLNRQFRFVGENGDTAGGFERSDEDPMFGTEQDITSGYNYAIYPWHKQNACDTKGNLKVIIPAVQEFYDDSRGIGARLLLVARDEGGDFYFKHVGAYIGVSLKGNGVSVASISFQGNNSEVLAGRPQVAFDENDLPVLTVDSQWEGNSETISMEFETPVTLNMDEEQVFWLIVPAITLSKGYTMTVTDANGGTFKKERTSSLTLERKKFYKLSSTVEISSYPAASVSLDKKELNLNVDEEAALTATVLPENATDKSVTWVSSDTAVATVDANGKVTAVAKGTATITVKTNDGGFEDSCVVTVSDVITYSLAIDPATAEINALESKEFSVILTTVKNGVTTESTVDVPLTTDELGGIEIIGKSVKGLEGGTFTIKASYTPEGSAELTAEATITVKDVYAYSLALTPADATINVGETQQYTATLSTSKNGGSATTSTVNATLTSSSDIVSIEGLTVKGLEGGSTTITASYTPEGAEAVTASATLKVSSVITYELAIDPAEDAEVNAGSTFAFKLILTTTADGEAETSDVTAGATWTSSDTAVATISAGTATGVKEGNVTITAKYTTPDGVEKTITAPLKVNKNPNQAGDDIPIGGGGSF